MYCTTMYMLWFSLHSAAPSESEFVILPEFATRVTPTKQIAREAQSVLCYKSIEFGRCPPPRQVHLGLHAKIN